MGALGHSSVSPVVPEPSRHRQTEIHTIRVGKAAPQGGADVVGFHIQLVQRREVGPSALERQMPEKKDRCAALASSSSPVSRRRSSANSRMVSWSR